MIVEHDDIERRVLTMLRQTLQDEQIQPDDSLDLSSIQTLKVLAHAEREFGVEIEDDDVFGGLFASPARLSAFIRRQLASV